MKFICEKCPRFHRYIFVSGTGRTLACDCQNYHDELPEEKLDLSATEDDFDEAFKRLDREYWSIMGQMLEDGWKGCEMLAEYMMEELNGR